LGLEWGKPCLIPKVKTETTFLDIWGNPTKPETAARIITKEFDAKGNYLGARITIDFKRAKF
jgi:hypothetical protein